MGTERADDLHAFRSFIDQQLANGTVPSTGEALARWDYENATDDERTASVQAIREALDDMRGRYRNTSGRSNRSTSPQAQPAYEALISHDVRVLVRARQDLDDIVTYISERSPEGAARLLASFEASLEGIARNPSLARLPRRATSLKTRYGTSCFVPEQAALTERYSL